jgi:cell division protein FtsQ
VRERLRAVGQRARAAWQVLRGPVVLVLRVLVLGAVASGALAGARLVERYARTADAFRTTEIAVEGASRLARDEVLAAAHLAIGQNVFEVAPERAQRELLRHPWIAKAGVVRRLPGSYRLRIVERHPAAIVVLDGNYLVSDDGVVFKAVEPGDPVDLPVVTGLGAADADERRPLLGNALGFIRSYADAGFAAHEPLGEIHVDPSDGLSAYVGADAAYARLGHPPFEPKLRRLRRVFERLAENEGRPAYVYLDNARRPDRVTVRAR